MIVLSEIPKEPRNAIWNIFSGIPEIVAYGATHLHWSKHSSSNLINKMFLRYRVEGINMSYTLADFHRDTIQEISAELSIEEKRKLLEDLPAGDKLGVMAGYFKNLGPEEKRAFLALILDTENQ